MPWSRHIRKSTISLSYVSFGVKPTSAFQLATVALWDARPLKLGWHALLRS